MYPLAAEREVLFPSGIEKYGYKFKYMIYILDVLKDPSHVWKYV